GLLVGLPLLAAVPGGVALRGLALGLRLAGLGGDALAEVPPLGLERLPRGGISAAERLALLVGLPLVRLARLGHRGPRWHGESDQRDGDHQNSFHAPPNARRETQLESYAGTALTRRSNRVTARPIATSQARA